MSFFSPTSGSLPCFLEYPASRHPYTCLVSEISSKLCLFPFRNENPRNKGCKILYPTYKEIPEPYVTNILRGLPWYPTVLDKHVDLVISEF